MGIQLVFSVLIYFLIIVLSVLMIKIWYDTLFLNETVEKRCLHLKADIKEKTEKHRIYTEHLLLADELHKSIFNRLFQITKELILMQKLIYGKRF
tara:strand:- start:2197 stop:2481 length:285 start_codon:yes stop_codon:yes gene_type:complete